jgi:hypothetical protein
MIAELRALEGRPINLKDMPEVTHEEFVKGVRMAQEKLRPPKKRMFSLRLPCATIAWWKSLGEGYTGIMSRLLEEAEKHPEWITQAMES